MQALISRTGSIVRIGVVCAVVIIQFPLKMRCYSSLAVHNRLISVAKIPQINKYNGIVPPPPSLFVAVGIILSSSLFAVASVVVVLVSGVVLTVVPDAAGCAASFL